MAEDRHSGIPGGNGSGANVKSGIELAIPDGSSNTVVFATPFASVPHVVATIEGALGAVDIVAVWNVTASQFQLKVYKGHGGSAHTWDVYWIATDAGDP